MSSQTASRMRSARDENTSQPLERALTVLEAVAASGGRLSVAGLAEELALPLPTAARIVRQLETMGLLRRAINTRRLLPGSRLLELGRQAVRASFLHDRPQALLAALAHSLGEHCQIGVVVDREVVYVASARVTRPAELHFEPGTAAPMHCTSTGKLFLASLPHPALLQTIAALDLTRHTPATITDPAVLIRAVQAVRRRGWASSGEEYVAGVIGCSVPIRNPGGSLVAGLGLSVPISRVGRNTISAFVPALQRGAAAIGDALTEEAAG
ncbi:MAG: IclR family transcriptional regulator [Acetobacteraceae bacterium]